MRNHWTDKIAIKSYLDLLAKEIASLCNTNYKLIQDLLEQEINRKPLTPEEINVFVMASPEEIVEEARRIYATLTGDSSGGLW